MSWWVYFTSDACEHCGRGDNEAERNLTYNLGELFRWAFGHDPNGGRDAGIWWLNGKSGAETLDTLRAARDRLEDPDHAALTSGMLPSNGWGTLDGAKEFVAWALDLASASPTGRWRVS